MLPPEQHESIHDAANRNDENRECIQNEIIGPINTFIDHFESYKNQQGTAEQGKRRREITTIWGIFITAGIAVITMVIFACQLHEMEKVYGPIAGQATAAKEAAQAANKSAEIAERALIAGQRAFVSISEFTQTAGMNIKTDKITNWQLAVTWINAGDTPTRNLRHHVNMRAFDGTIPNDWEFPDQWEGQIPPPERKWIGYVINAKMPFHGGGVAFPVETMEAVIAGKKHLYAWGWAEYNDVFPNTKKHIVRFATEILVAGDPRDKDRMSFRYSTLHRYNCSDEECNSTYPSGWMPRDVIISKPEPP